jgi:hypothetical protein
MFMIHNTVREEDTEYLDVKMYESLTPNEEGLVSHTRIFRDEAGQMNEHVVFHRDTDSMEAVVA